MAHFDYDGNGKKDFWDDMIELDAMDQERRTKNADLSFTEEEKGCLSDMWGCFCIIVFIGMIGLLFTNMFS